MPCYGALRAQRCRRGSLKKSPCPSAPHRGGAGEARSQARERTCRRLKARAMSAPWTETPPGRPSGWESGPHATTVPRRGVHPGGKTGLADPPKPRVQATRRRGPLDVPSRINLPFSICMH